METYEVRVTPEAKHLVREHLLYLLLEIQNEQAYDAVKEDYFNTLNRLTNIAGAIGDHPNKKLRERNIRMILFEKHNYLLLFRVKGSVAEVLGMFHESEQYEEKV